MSLSFVSSAVQIGTSDGGFEETKIENKETEAVNRRNAHKPLFEQLRSNQEEDQEKKDEMQRQIMRSTCALDDEDVAHLDSLERQRSDRERKIQERTKNELDNFRAAKALRQQAALAGNQEEEDVDSDSNTNPLGVPLTGSGKGDGKLGSKAKVSVVPANSLPVIKVKKRKRRVNPSNDTSQVDKIAEKKRNLELKTDSTKNEDESASLSNETTKTPALPVADLKSGNGLGGLLSGYGSSSDED